jgi:hypothetical protein
MGWRFNRRTRLFPGLSLNWSARGLSSVSIGGAPFTVNVPVARDGGVRQTASIPGTGLSHVDPGPSQRGSVRQRRQAQNPQLPTTEKLVALMAEAFDGPEGAGVLLWQEHGIGLIRYLQDREDTPRSILEKTSLLVSRDRVELHVRRGRTPADSLRRAKEVTSAATDVIEYGRSIGVVKD